MAATLAGTPSLLRRKSITRWRCLWPPPRWRDVIRPYPLRPPVFGFGFVRRFSGVSLVISEKSDDVWNRRPGLVGLRLRMGMPSAPEDVDTVLAGGEGDDRALLARGCVVRPCLAVAGALALAVDRVDLLH